MWDSLYSKAYAQQQQLWNEGAEGILEHYECLAPEGPVLDLGCGEGQNALYFSHKGRFTKAVDSSKVVIQRMKERWDSSGLPIEWIQTDITQLELPARTYSIVIISNVLPFIEAEKCCLMIKKSKKSLKEGGLLYLKTFSLEDPSFLSSEVKNDLGEGLFSTGSGRTFFTREKLLNLVAPLSTIYLAEIQHLDFGHGEDGAHMHGLIEYLGRV